MTICSVFWRADDLGFKNFQEWYRRIVYAVRIAVNRFFLRSGWFEMPYQAMGTGRAARGGRKSGADGCRGASWSEELDGKELRGALGGKRNLKPRESPFSGHRLAILLRRLQCGMLISKCSPCTAAHYQTVSLSWAMLFTYFRIQFASSITYNTIELALAANVVLSAERVAL